MRTNDEQQKHDLESLALVNKARNYVMTAKPNTHVMYTVNKQGERTHFGIYDCSLELNDKKNLCKEQPAPQLIGDLITYQLAPLDRVAQLLHVGAWCSAADDVGRLNMNLSKVADAMGLKREGEE
jgi:hypothetical protein